MAKQLTAEQTEKIENARTLAKAIDDSPYAPWVKEEQDRADAATHSMHVHHRLFEMLGRDDELSIMQAGIGAKLVTERAAHRASFNTQAHVYLLAMDDTEGKLFKYLSSDGTLAGVSADDREVLYNIAFRRRVGDALRAIEMYEEHDFWRTFGECYYQIVDDAKKVLIRESLEAEAAGTTATATIAGTLDRFTRILTQIDHELVEDE